MRIGETVVLATATANPDPREGIDFFPLTVDYREYTYAGGRFPGGFIKREGRPSEREILTSRQIDRPIRPLFPDGFKCETQVIAFVLSADTENDPDVAGINGASAALTISDIPFNGPIGAVRVGMVSGAFVINPTYAEMRESLLNIMVVGTAEGIVMIESGAKEVKEETVVDAIEFGHTEIKKICAAINDLKKKAGKTEASSHAARVRSGLLRCAEEESRQRSNRPPRHRETSQGRKLQPGPRAKERTASRDPRRRRRSASQVQTYFETLRERIFREAVINHKRRPDGRAFDQIRDIWIEVGVLPRTHGSAIFTRGETQALVTTTLRHQRRQTTPRNLRRRSQEKVSPALQFSAVSVWARFRSCAERDGGRLGMELWRSGRFRLCCLRRRTGLTRCAWCPTFWSRMDLLRWHRFAGLLCALMDAGVPLKAPVAGVAMGLVKEGDAYAILTDIAGAEDHYGDMDFKVAGTKDGITALQMDIKVGGITAQIMREALAQAQRGRLYILDKMMEAITGPREKVSAYAPRIYTLQIPVDKIRDVIGPGGKMIRSIIEQTGVKIDVEDSGKVNVASNDEASANKALQIIRDLTASAEVGKTYLGKGHAAGGFRGFC